LPVGCARANHRSVVRPGADRAAASSDALIAWGHSQSRYLRLAHACWLRRSSVHGWLLRLWSARVWWPRRSSVHVSWLRRSSVHGWLLRPWSARVW
jgi:hypothetical protein